MALPETESPPESAASAAVEDVNSNAERTTRPIMRVSLSSISLAGATQSEPPIGLSIRRHPSSGLCWRVTAIDDSCLARRARVHVDFHPYGDFNDFRSVPGHVFLFSSWGRQHVCFPTIACFAWWAHLSTRIRRRNCDQGSRPERRLWRAAEPIGPRSNPSPGSMHLQVDSSFVERTTFGRTELLRRRTKFDWRRGVMRARRCSHELLPSAYTRPTTLLALCLRWAKQRRIVSPRIQP